MNLALILVVLTAVSGAVVAMNRFVWQKREQRLSSGLATLVEYSQSFFPVLLLVLVIRSFIFEPFRIPSGSMEPTLLRGDFIFVKKYSYGLRLPVVETKIVETGEPERGDVVVFRLPSEPSVNYIKRVVGLPASPWREPGAVIWIRCLRSPRVSRNTWGSSSCASSTASPLIVSR